jgi:PIN domain nuclease of toxin-antitoxin system
MITAITDTHTLIWYVTDAPQLSTAARAMFDQAVVSGNHIGFSTITLAETIYLIEKYRLPDDMYGRLIAALDTPGTVLVLVPFHRDTVEAMRRVDRTQVPDMPDRIIAATALALGVPLITRDEKLRQSTVPTIW